ncbi:hypothetical protein BDM02DRAFT_3121934 [Thelephora ganbajun]|uniref:Uncharacterized protein n=1 Tax=Thelephora ganbajun TaxID=370292 RepID=A0ACB6Z429_THEGA|nr:hypothetical protein BDM02DRAFT_3121934 [Thelephora ganbajun]
MSLEQAPWCPCSADGAPIYQTHLHILQECNHYATQHHILLEVIPDIYNPSWQPHLLASPSSIQTFTMFLQKSGAFTKLGIPFHLNLILPPPHDPKPL